jgi:hypothetical protein
VRTISVSVVAPSPPPKTPGPRESASPIDVI